MTHAFRIAMAAVCVLLGAGTHPAFASSQTQTYELELFVPQISQAANGELVSITGGGLFSIHPKTVSANLRTAMVTAMLSPMEHGLPLDS